jgi:Derlin-2/3
MVDDRNCTYKRLGAVPNSHSFPAVLQLPGCLRQESGTFLNVQLLTNQPNPRSQYWRLLTTFLYFGPLSLDLVFHVFFLQRYSRLLEESSGRSPAHFSWLLLYATTCLICLSPLVSMPFLGHPLSSTLVYIWSRRNPDTRLSFLGLMVFTAPYLPWVLMGFSLVVHGMIPKDEIMGVVIGHVWYFFSDVYPPLHNGSRPFDPPMWWRRIFEGRPQQETADAIHNEIAVAAAPAPEVR